MTVRSIVVAGSDGELGRLVRAQLDARGLELRCPQPVQGGALPEVADVDVVINLAGPRVRPGLDWPDYFREHVANSRLDSRSRTFLAGQAHARRKGMLKPTRTHS